jgi:hypothetical protein
MSERLSDERLAELVAAVDNNPAAVLLTHPKDMESALRELQSLREQVRWRPMGEAPRDGTRVLLRLPNDYIACGAWNDDRYAKKPRPYWDADNTHYMGKTYARERPPTGWMPLPEIGPLPGGEG